MRALKWTPGNYMLRVGRSLLGGRGVFALSDIPKGVCIIEYKGKRVHDPDSYPGEGRYFFEVGRGWIIDGNIAGNTARFINHSCKPNCEADGPRGKVFIFSTRRIKAGEELTYDYGDEYFDEHLKGKCRCPKHALKQRNSKR